MKVLRRFIYREAIAAVAYVTIGFLALFSFFDLLDELRWINHGGYQLSHALLSVALRMPSHLYELLPITVLIGTIFVMASLAQSSEFTIMRTSGLGPWRALRTLLVLGCGFVLLTFAIGDYASPMADRAGQLVKARYQGRVTAGATGAWLKERQPQHSLAVNVRALGPDGGMLDIRVFEFNAEGRLSAQLQAASGQFSADGDAWILNDVKQSRFIQEGANAAHVEHLDTPTLRWPTHISSEMVTAALLKPERMATIDLFQYIRHLEVRDRVLAQGLLPHELSRNGGALPAFRLPAFPLWRHCRLCIWRRHGWHQLLPAQQRLRLCGQPAELVALADGGSTGAHLFRAFTRGLWLAGAAALTTDSHANTGLAALRGILLFGHGSRDALWRAPIEAVAAQITQNQPGLAVACAYLELCEPTLAQATANLVAQGVRHFTLVPMFLGTGRHARQDLPLLVQELRTRYPNTQWHVQAPIGEDPRMTALMAQIAAQATENTAAPTTS
jgi:lipopolysaccharide export system permease protein